MNNTDKWPLYIRSLVVYFHDEELYPFSFIAEVLKRETQCKMTKNTVIGLYSRFKKSNINLNYELIKDFLPGTHGYFRKKVTD